MNFRVDDSGRMRVRLEQDEVKCLLATQGDVTVPPLEISCGWDSRDWFRLEIAFCPGHVGPDVTLSEKNRLKIGLSAENLNDLLAGQTLIGGAGSGGGSVEIEVDRFSR